LALLRTAHTSIRAIVSCVPAQVEHTSAYANFSKEEQDLFTKTTGIRERRVAPAAVTCADLCYDAASLILQTYGNDIDALLFVTQSPDYYLPASAVILQERLGISKGCLAFDINLGCSGYVYGLSVASSLMQGGYLKKVLLLAGDKSTLSTHYKDKSAYPLFGDAGTATLLEYDAQAEPWQFNLQSDGSGKNAIIIEHGHSRHPYDESSEVLEEIEPGISRTKKNLSLNGTDIFNFALREVASNINSLYEWSGLDKERTDFAVFHQANKLINESVRKKLKMPVEKVPYSIDAFGNTSSASIPLTICHALKEQVKDAKLNLLLSGFGVGYSWGSVLLSSSGIYTAMIEHD